MREWLTLLAAKGWDRLPKFKVEGSVIGNILNWVYGLLGLLAVAMIVYAGVLYLTSEGDAGKAKKARAVVQWAVIGLLIVLVAFAITNFVASNILSAGGMI